jgi:hypothetical protein
MGGSGNVHPSLFKFYLSEDKIFKSYRIEIIINQIIKLVPETTGTTPVAHVAMMGA